MKLTILIPVFNEEKTVITVLKKVLSLKIPSVGIEVIVINDGSSDSTNSLIKEFQKNRGSNFLFLSHKKNSGKGSAVRTGIKKAKGDYIIIQDADLEYNPQDIARLVKEIVDIEKDVIYGTRLNRLPNLKNAERTFRFLLHYFGNRMLSVMTSILYGKWITDMETCYKLFPRKIVQNMNLKAKGFEFEPELTAKLFKRNVNYVEVSITAVPRGYSEGKKLNTFRDGFKALVTLIKYRFTD